MKYKGNVYSYFNLSGILFCIFIAWASYYNYKNLQISGLLAFFVSCVLKCAMLAKFKKDILEKDTPLLCIFRKNRALAPHERSAVPLGTDHCPVG